MRSWMPSECKAILETITFIKEGSFEIKEVHPYKLARKYTYFGWRRIGIFTREDKKFKVFYDFESCYPKRSDEFAIEVLSQDKDIVLIHDLRKNLFFTVYRVTRQNSVDTSYFIEDKNCIALERMN